MRKQTIEETGHKMVEETMGPYLSIMSDVYAFLAFSRLRATSLITPWMGTIGTTLPFLWVVPWTGGTNDLVGRH